MRDAVLLCQLLCAGLSGLRGARDMTGELVFKERAAAQTFIIVTFVLQYSFATCAQQCRRPNAMCLSLARESLVSLMLGPNLVQIRVLFRSVGGSRREPCDGM